MIIGPHCAGPRIGVRNTSRAPEYRLSTSTDTGVRPGREWKLCVSPSLPRRHRTLGRWGKDPP